MRENPSRNTYKPISDYGVIGDCRSAALVGLDGSIDWCCFPRFDSPSVFAAILDAGKGGHFAITPQETYSATQRYLDNTNILET
jgi:alpha,alpha-trehalase